MTRLLLLPIALAAAASVAQDGSRSTLLGAPACRRAVDQLEAREAAAARDGRSARAELDAARRQAAVACLGGHDAPASAPAARPPATGRPTAPPGRPPEGRPPPTGIPTPVPRPAAPVTITACDATGCWASDGSRLQRVGPNLLGPKGICSTSGSILTCPP